VQLVRWIASQLQSERSGQTSAKLHGNINGPAELKEQGDPFVYCEEGPSQGPPADPSANLSPLPYTTYNGLATNHPQYLDALSNHCGVPVTGGNPGNPDQQPQYFSGPMTTGTAHPGAYNYVVNIPSTKSDSSIWIYNPAFVPFIASGNSCPGTQAVDTFYKSLSCANWYKQYGPLTFNGYFDDPRFYFNTTFTVYQVSTPFRNLDVPIDGNCFRRCGRYDQMKQDLRLHGCSTSGSQVYDFTGSSSYSGAPIAKGVGCVPAPTCQQQWCQIAGDLPAGTYRVAVEATSFTNPTNFNLGWGQHSYGLKVCANGTPNGVGGAVGCVSGGSVAAWNNMDITLSFPSAKTINIFPIGDVPASYAGRSIT